MKTTCNNCLGAFEIEADSFQTVRIENLEIQYFSRPSCEQKYVVFAADDEMKRLVAARIQLQKRIKAANFRNFRPKTISRIISQLSNEHTTLIREQKKLWAELKPRAEQLLKEADHGDV